MSKLLKYEFKDTAPLLAVFTLGVLALTMILMGIYRLQIPFISTLVLGIATLGPIIYFLAVFFYLAFFRYYHSLYSGQGYLTHCLPIKGSTIYSAKLLYTALSLLVALIVAGICLIAKQIIANGMESFLDLFHTMMDILSTNGTMLGVFLAASLINCILVSPILGMFAITMGCGKHLVQLGKIPGIILAVVLTYIGTQVISLVSLAIPIGIASDGDLVIGTRVYEGILSSMSATVNGTLSTIPIGWFPATLALAIVLALVTSNQIRYHSTLR